VTTNLTHEESEVVRALQDAGMSLQEATLAVVMFTRGHERPENELINIIDVYPGLANAQVMQQAIHQLITSNWLVTDTSFGLTVTKAAPDLQAKLAARIHNPRLVSHLTQPSTDTNKLPPNIRLIGPTSNQHSYGTFLDLLRHAQNEICLPMLITPPYQATASILQERASHGVHVRILLAHPQVAVKIRGKTFASKAERSLKEWKKTVQDRPNMEIRVSHRVEDMYHLATSWTLDRKLLRYDFYAPYHQRSLAGYLIEFDSRTGPELNIIHMFQACFDNAWRQAQPTTRLLGIWWRIKQNWQWGAGLVTALIAIPFGTSIWGSIIASIAATFWFNALVSSWDMIRQTLRNWMS
jgi:hypothetical protein